MKLNTMLIIIILQEYHLIHTIDFLMITVVNGKITGRCGFRHWRRGTPRNQVKTNLANLVHTSDSGANPALAGDPY